MAKLNCWEFKHCGREPGGTRVSELGVCPAATETRVDRINDGTNGGRCCWAIVGTLCGGKVQGSFATKVSSCLKCDFNNLVVAEQGNHLAYIKDILDKMK